MRVFFLINVARRRTGPQPALLESMAALFRRRGVECRMEFSHSIEQCRDLLDQAARGGYDSLWIGGGDGTVNHVLNSTVGKFASYAVVPMGTINGLARALGIPRDPLQAVEWLLDGEPTGLELGRVGDRYFVLYATIGFHAAVFHNTHPGLKRAVGRAAFFAAGALEACRARELPRFQVELKTVGSLPDCGVSAAPRRGVSPIWMPAPVEAAGVPLEEPIITADAPPAPSEIQVVRREGYSLVISNFWNFSGFGAVREGDICDSSLLLTHLFPTCSLWPMLRFFSAMRYRRPREDDPGVEHYRVSEVTVRSESPLWLQVDGEPVHQGDDRVFRFTCLPQAIQVLWNRQAVMQEAEERQEALGGFQ